MRNEVLKRIKGFGYGALGAGLLALLTFVSGNLDLIEMTNISTEMKVLIIGCLTALINQATKFLNNKFQLEERAIAGVRRLAGKG